MTLPGFRIRDRLSSFGRGPSRVLSPSRSRAKVLWRLFAIVMAAWGCGAAHADWYYGFAVLDPGGFTRGNSGGTKYFSYGEVVQAVRAFYNAGDGGLAWQFVDTSPDRLMLWHPFRPIDNYGASVGANQYVYGPSVDGVCTTSAAANCAGCFYTGARTPFWPEVLYDHWTCQDKYPDPQTLSGYGNFSMSVDPHCAPPGYAYSEYGRTDRYGRTVPQATCYSNYYAEIGAISDPGKPSDCCVGNPVHPALGIKTDRAVIYAGSSGPQPLKFEWLYSSNMYNTLVKLAGWSHTYSRRIGTSTVAVFAYRPTGFIVRFTPNGPNYLPDADLSDRLTRLVDAGGHTTGWTYTVSPTDEVETYDAAGNLLSIRDRMGATTTMTYSDATTPTAIAPYAGLLIRITDALGRQLNLTYNGSGLLRSLTDPAGNTFSFGFDQYKNLVTIGSPDNKMRQFLYENTTYANALTGIIDENGQRFATYGYDIHGRATNTQHAGGVESYTFAFNADGSSSVTDPLGVNRIYGFASVRGAVKNTSLSQPCSSCGVTGSAQTYDANGNVASRTDFNGKQVCNAYDLSRNLETARVEGVLSSEICANVLASPPNRPDVRKVTTTWHPTFRLPATITEPAPGGTKTTTFTYDGFGNLTQKSITAPKNDGSGNTVTRTWNWTYGSYGRVLTATDPDNHTTTTTYYADNDPDLGKRGYVATSTNAAGHVTTVTGYDLAGRPLSLTDPNGLTTTLTYHARGWLTSRTIGAETTGYTYDGVGQLTKVTLPDGSYVQYTYDAAHRLTQINDGLGNRIAYTLDAMGNRTREDAYDPSAHLARTRSHTFDTLNRMASDLGAQSQTTLYTYDNNGNLLTATDPLNHQTGNTYDALNRLIQVLDPNSGATAYAYDGANNLTQVTDPRGSATTYSYDGLNNLIKLVSPDTGTTTSTYDAAGNLVTRTDARGATATYTYDALNRVTQVIYSKSVTPSETHVFTYDSGANAKGRLSGISDPAAITSWTYNGQGRMASKGQQVGAVSRSVAYGYNASGQMATLTTPSGQQIGYAYTNNRIASITINGQSLLTGANTTPFGPLAAWHWGNGLFSFRDHDSDGRLATWEFRNGASLLRKDQSFDLGSRISAIADPHNAAASQAYQYDALDRLTVAQSGNPVTHTQQFSYDAVGNRQNATLDGAAANLFYAATGNQLQRMVGMVSANYLNGASALSLAYNNANRLVQVQRSGVTVATYGVNALGQRVSKTASGTTTLFVYDELGHLLGEYDGAGNLIQETVWLEDLPVATLRPNGTGNPTPIAVYYVHADHLGSPRAVTRPSDNAMMWQWDNLDPFGVNAANENPSGQGTFKYALRFPGQYYDAETGTHYNYFRDYDPAIGRYEQSDPIGLRGGPSTYAYVGDSPLKFFDIDGLDPWGGDPGQSYYCTGPLHSAPWLDIAPIYPAHHGYICTSDGICGGQDRQGNPFYSLGKASEGDKFNPARCEPVGPLSRCMVDCANAGIQGARPPYTVVPWWPLFGGKAMNCQDFAKLNLLSCVQQCSDRLLAQ